MGKVGYIVGYFVLVSIMVVLVGCAEKMVCAPPNILVGDVCCLDSDDTGVCDTWEVEDELVIAMPEEVPEDTAMIDFAGVFVDTWNRKSYNALRNLFVDDYRLKYSPQEFNFLARKADKMMDVGSITLVDIVDDTVRFKIYEGGVSSVVSADIDEEDGVYKFDFFYMFTDLSAESACEGDDRCFMDFAVLSGDRNYCDLAGGLKADCVANFGVSKDITEKIDDCMEILEYYSKTECLTQVAVKENDIEPCWQASYDKQMYECMGFVAAARSDVTECERFVAARGYPGTRLQKTYCITGYVKETGDTTACSLIDRRDDVVLGAMQEGCYKMQFS